MADAAVADQFCTIATRPYLAQVLALHESLARHATRPFCLQVLSMDGATDEALAALRVPHLVATPIAALEAADPDLRRVRADRDGKEYCYTAKAAFMAHLLPMCPADRPLTFLDADTWFFADPQAWLRGLGRSAALLTEHRFTYKPRRRDEFGAYNAGVLAFRHSAAGLAALGRWREQCIAWCYRRHEDGRFAEQRYLEGLAANSESVAVSDHPGVNVAWWNLGTRTVTSRSGGVYVNDVPLVVYHFSGVSALSTLFYDTQPLLPPTDTHHARMALIYAPYLAALGRWTRRLSAVQPAERPRTSATNLLRAAGRGGLVLVLVRPPFWMRVHVPRLAAALSALRRWSMRRTPADGGQR